MSGLARKILFAPTESTTAFELAATGQSSTSRFHGLSVGKTSRAERIGPAAGSSNETGLVIAGIFVDWMRLIRAWSPPTAGARAAGVPPVSGVIVGTTSWLPIFP